MAKSVEPKEWKCQTCVFGTVVHHMRHEGEDQEKWKDPVEVAQAFCNNDLIAGEGKVETFGRVTSCEGYLSRAEQTLRQKVLDKVEEHLTQMGPADFGDQYGEYMLGITAGIMTAMREKRPKAIEDALISQAACAVAQVVAMRRKEKAVEPAKPS